MSSFKLFMLLIGCKPKGRHTEQHDVFFGIAPSMKELIPQLIEFWPEAEGKLHIDAYREVTQVNGYEVKVIPATAPSSSSAKLFFINLGGYKQNEFEEFHYKLIYAAADKAEAIHNSKQTAFYKHTRFKGAESHIDDKYGVDVDDVFEIEDILTPALKKSYALSITKAKADLPEDELHLGYFKLSSFD
jgi:Domain of Unknown Function (DUF1543)